jgi:hypothetical protein
MVKLHNKPKAAVHAGAFMLTGPREEEEVWLNFNVIVFFSSSVGVSGTIQTNGHPRQLKSFSKLSSYIMQEDLIQPFLTVKEGMQVAANLKLGDELKASEKQLAVRQ